MRQILKPNAAVMSILKKRTASGSAYRMIKYHAETKTEDGILLFNLLTRELLLLSEEEYANRLNSEYLRSSWFVVPEEINEKEYVKLARLVLNTLGNNGDYIAKYTILTTTDCNARCFYCYELGCARVPMSEETAHKTADYIINNCGGHKVELSWFGGEPLYNASVIDLICKRLREANIKYRSKMFTNGYLFHQENVDKAVNDWALESLQISLDGTEEVYNKSKAYIYKTGSAYQIVMENIGRLLDAGIAVTVRLNTDLYNADDLMVLVDELAKRFEKNNDKLEIYIFPLFDDNKPQDQRYTPEDLKLLYDKIGSLTKKVSQYGLSRMKSLRLRTAPRTRHCMADSDHTAVVRPDGNLALCDHKDEFFSHIDTQERDQAMIESWKELCEELPECNDCFYYPDCVRLKKCTNPISCTKYTREQNRYSLESLVVKELKLWKEQNT